MDTSRLKKIALELRQKEELDKGIKIANKRQRRMLPDIPKLSGVDIAALFLPASRVSGDFYDFIDLQSDRWGISLGDISGHGIEAGIIMGMAKKALQIYAKENTSPKETLVITNEDLVKDLDGETFLSAMYGILDVGEKSFTFARAGHNPPMLLNLNRTPQLRELKPNGMVIGVDKTGKRFSASMEEVSINLQSGDLLFMYTDGLVEAHNSIKEEFGEYLLARTLKKFYHRPVLEILHNVEQAIQNHIGSRVQEDDITMLAVKVIE